MLGRLNHRIGARTPLLGRLNHRIGTRTPLLCRPFASTHNVPFNEPGGNFLNVPKDEPVDWTRRIYVVGYLGGLAVFAFLWQYKPDTSAESWGRAEALQRMRARGIDLSTLDD